MPPETPILKGERVVLRPFTMDDAPRVAALCAAREISEMTLLIPHPYSIDDARGWLETHQGALEREEAHQWAICEGGVVVGAIGLIRGALNNRHRRAEVGYWVGKPYWGQGFATAAGLLVLGFAFETLRLNRVYSFHFATNPASGRVLEKMGMQREGVARQEIFKWGEFVDSVRFGILREDWARDGQPGGKGAGGRGS